MAFFMNLIFMHVGYIRFSSWKKRENHFEIQMVLGRGRYCNLNSHISKRKGFFVLNQVSKFNSLFLNTPPVCMHYIYTIRMSKLGHENPLGENLLHLLPSPLKKSSGKEHHKKIEHGWPENTHELLAMTAWWPATVFGPLWKISVCWLMKKTVNFGFFLIMLKRM